MDLLARIPPGRIGRSAPLSYAAGSIASGMDKLDEALRWFASAQAHARRSDATLVARLALEMGYVHLRKSEALAAASVADWAEGVTADPELGDLVHLRALIADHRGEHGEARRLYRRALSARTPPLTPTSRILALVNLAVALTPARPSESRGLCHTALALADAYCLHPRYLAVIRNALGFALLCTGELGEARRELSRARALAVSAGYGRLRCYAEFNTAIVDEHEGFLDVSARRLRAVSGRAARVGIYDLVTWTRIRSAWLMLRQMTLPPASVLDELRCLPPAFASAARVLHAIACLLSRETGAARREIRRLVAEARDHDDLLTEMALLLWLTRLEAGQGRGRIAARHVAEARSVAERCGTTRSPNWWIPEFNELLVDGTSALDRCTDTARSARQEEVAVIGGRLTVDGGPLPETAWREGRTGPTVLKRFLALLADQHPSGIPRERVCDVMWPDCDGDRALRNLYAATYDLRRVLSRVSGISLYVSDGTYALRSAAGVVVRA